MTETSYCLKEKKQTGFKEKPTIIRTKNGNYALKGTCPCGTIKYKNINSVTQCNFPEKVHNPDEVSILLLIPEVTVADTVLTAIDKLEEEGFVVVKKFISRKRIKIQNSILFLRFVPKTLLYKSITKYLIKT